MHILTQRWLLAAWLVLLMMFNIWTAMRVASSWWIAALPASMAVVCCALLGLNAYDMLQDWALTHNHREEE